MIKMADDSEGKAERRAIHKGVTEGDKERLKRGVRQFFPEAAGLPPILTIMALSMKVAGKVRERL